MYAIRSYYVPFANFVAVIEDVEPQVLKAALENSVSALEGGLNSGSGRFLQVAGINIEWNKAEKSLQYDNEGNVIGGNSGQRIWSAYLSVITSYSIHYTKLYDPRRTGHCSPSRKLMPMAALWAR